ncbi:hypothetical protein GLOTRDRAFT_108852 [Gloeophyllum trabeum ATCC 11539]|uniref:Uncharacterized protein n=1 Tax=Gloeophyllum trabeum (strain ATCC 11539 / FP-39264 / Madison 617) TaxID=670483 RepID=S7QLH4_GLOTA|nr:uncharacterized protein GLOTRDRAFT_108852 [Gloeophyllum trabeum ATCC 11539]EPQ60218.1 hypothetical protein GLOTRDRAFT_108852 [Gloeophyllum trabeum ATCC 11539]
MTGQAANVALNEASRGPLSGPNMSRLIDVDETARTVPILVVSSSRGAKRRWRHVQRPDGEHSKYQGPAIHGHCQLAIGTESARTE